ncbi:MAG: hypothetical protein ACKO3S_01745 [bacterium]
MSRPRSAALAALVTVVLLLPSVAFAAAEVRKLNLALSATPTQVFADDFNDGLEYYNRTVLAPPPRGYEPLAKVGMSWLFDSELRYFATRNLSFNAGVGQLRAKSGKEYLPALGQSINVRAELLTVPVHVGASYYMQPYNQGDFQARMFVGGGFVQYTYSRTTFSQQLAGADSATTVQLGGSYKLTSTQDAPGYYAETGVHMFFASRYSVLLAALYRSGKVSGLVDEATGQPVIDPITNKPTSLDVGGFGLRLAAVIGL